MTAVTTQRGIRRLAALLAVMMAFVLSGCTPEQTEVLTLVNETRATHGLPPLLPDLAAMDKAQAWAEHLAAADVLEHSDLTAGMPHGWTIIGENVGRGPSIEAIHAAYIASPDHYANIVDPRFRWMGTGHAVDPNGKVYTVHVFSSYQDR